MINELFEKIVYESEDFKGLQRDIDSDLERMVERLYHTQEMEREEIRDMLAGILYRTQREMFAIGFKCGISLMHESGISSEDIHNL